LCLICFHNHSKNTIYFPESPTSITTHICYYWVYYEIHSKLPKNVLFLQRSICGFELSYKLKTLHLSYSYDVSHEFKWILLFAKTRMVVLIVWRLFNFLTIGYNSFTHGFTTSLLYETIIVVTNQTIDLIQLLHVCRNHNFTSPFMLKT
jgi:hypothetical protein